MSKTEVPDGSNDSPFPWVDVKFVPGTSVVNASVMLLAATGECIGIVTTIGTRNPSIQLEVTRALSGSGNPAKLRRNLIAARHGEEEHYVRAEAAEAALKVAMKALELYAKRVQFGDGVPAQTAIASVNQLLGGAKG